jgi:hypothetical protein
MSFTLKRCGSPVDEADDEDEDVERLFLSQVALSRRSSEGIGVRQSGVRVARSKKRKKIRKPGDLFVFEIILNVFK